MQKSKREPEFDDAKKALQRFDQEAEFDDEEFDYDDQDLVYEATPEQYLVTPTQKRRELTARDEARNQKVEQLFHNLLPGVPLDADPHELRQDPTPFEDVLGTLLQQLKISETPWMKDLDAAWSDLVTPEVAQVARPGKLVNGVLYVYVTSSIKLHELRRTHLRKIERAVKQFAGKGRVRHVHLMVNSVPS